MLIECKTTDSSDSEFDKAWEKTKLDGGQLFNYFNTYRQAEFLCLYTADFEEDELRSIYYYIQMNDIDDIIGGKKDLLTFEKVRLDQGPIEDYFSVWSNTYAYQYYTSGIFEEEFPPLCIGLRKFKFDDLKEIGISEIDKKYHQFAETLRRYNVASHENAFDKLINLFLVKVVDEEQNPEDLQFPWKGNARDNFYDFIDRLQYLYKIGMREFLSEEVTYVDEKSIDEAFHLLKYDPDETKRTIKEYFRELKFFSNSDFGFLDVHNEQLFRQNATILRDMVIMLQDIKLKDNKQQQFLGNLFELFLDQGVKQNEGQFFTPTPITRFMVSALPLQEIIGNGKSIPDVIDYACGAGHFLTEFARQIKPIVQSNKKTNISDYYNHIYGIEKEYRLHKVSKVSSFMYGQKGINIIYADALAENEKIKNNSFSVIIANPPFSVPGFLTTLSNEDKVRYELFKHTESAELSKMGDIEVFFVERASQLLCKGGVAAIILPSTVLTDKSNLYAKCRELIMTDFEIISIVELEKNTFMQTKSTSVSIWFLRKRQDKPSLLKHCTNRVNDWFSLDFSKDEKYQDHQLLMEYCNSIELSYDIFHSLMSSNLSEEALNSDWYFDYFDSIKEEGGYNRILNKKITTKFTETDRQNQLDLYVLNRIREVEKAKLTTYLIASNNKRPILIVKSPSKDNEMKTFLGYTWSKQKNKEGMDVIDSKKNDVNEIKTVLYNPKDLYSTNVEKINSLIRLHFNNLEFEIPSILQKYASKVELKEMLDLNNNTSFFRTLKTGVSEKVEFESSKYPLVKLSKVVKLNPKKMEISEVPDDTLVSFVEMSSLGLGLIESKTDKKIQDVRKGSSYTYFAEEDLIIAKITPCMENGKCAIARGLTNKIAFGSSELHVLRCSEHISNEYLFLLLNNDYVREIATKNFTGKSGHRRVPESFYKDLYIPLPESLEEQLNIVNKCKAYKGNKWNLLLELIK